MLKKYKLVIYVQLSSVLFLTSAHAGLFSFWNEKGTPVQVDIIPYKELSAECLSVESISPESIGVLIQKRELRREVCQKAIQSVDLFIDKENIKQKPELAELLTQLRVLHRKLEGELDRAGRIHIVSPRLEEPSKTTKLTVHLPKLLAAPAPIVQPICPPAPSTLSQLTAFMNGIRETLVGQWNQQDTVLIKEGPTEVQSRGDGNEHLARNNRAALRPTQSIKDRIQLRNKRILKQTQKAQESIKKVEEFNTHLIQIGR